MRMCLCDHVGRVHMHMHTLMNIHTHVHTHTHTTHYVHTHTTSGDCRRGRVLSHVQFQELAGLPSPAS